METFVTKLDPASDDFVIEVYAAEITAVLDRWSDGLCRASGAARLAATDLSPEIAASSLRASETVPLRSTGPLRVERRLFRGPETSGADRFLLGWTEFFSSFAPLRIAELRIFGIIVTHDSPLRVQTEIRYDFVGKLRDGSPEQRVGSWTVTWVKSNQSNWTAERLQAGPEIRSHLTGPGFTDITDRCIDPNTPGAAQLACGIDYWRTVLDASCGIDVYGNHGVCVGDIDGSGFDSFYVCQPAGLPNRLYRNRGHGTFEDITEVSGTGILDGTASALFADFYNRGKQDLLVIRTGGPLLFVSQGEGRFEPRPDAFQFARPPQGTFTSAAISDYNRDGLLDVYFCVYSYYQGLSQYQFPSPYYDAQNGPPNYLFRNRGDGTFEDVTSSSGMNQNNNRFSFAAAWCDYDNDGWPDLYVANDFGRKNLYRNRAGKFADVADHAGVEDYGPGMSVCWLDSDNDGRQDIYVANMWLNEGKRITADSYFLTNAPPDIRALYRKHNAGNSLYKNKGDGGFEDRTVEAGAAMGRWSWSCASWDFEHDGHSDIYVANGFVSGPNRYDLQSFFWRQIAQRSYAEPGTSTDYERAWNAVNELVRSDYSWSGYERNVFFANNGDGTFSDVSGVLGLDLRDDSRAYALSDLDGDGRLEFVLKNRTGPQLRIFRNAMQEIGNSVSFDLRGTVSNRDAIGATVSIVAGAPPQTKFVSAGSGFASQHTKQLFFGVGAASSVSVAVTWPNGVTARYDDIAVNHRVIIEEGHKEIRILAYRAYLPVPLATAMPLPPPDPATVSTWLIEPLFGPGGIVRDLRGRPTLLAFFRADCGDSQGQLARLQKNLPAISATGLQVYGVAVNSATSRAMVDELVRAEKISFPVVLPDDRVIGAWNVYYRYLFDRRRDMPIPQLVLLDRSGAVVCLYGGLVDPLKVVADWNSAPATAEERLARALPFPGPNYGNAMHRNYFTLGVAFVEYGYPDEAQSAFQRAVEANPNFSSAWFNLGTVYLNKKMYREARKALSETIRLNPQDPDAWNNLGMISGEEGKYDQALEEFLRAATANPNYLVPVQNMMHIYEYQGRPADAQETLEKLILKAPKNPDLHMGLGRALVAQNKMERAVEELETVVQLRPESPDALNDLGAVLLRMGRLRDALSRFDGSRRLAPDFDRPCINAALVYQSAGKPEKGRELLEDFLNKHPDNTAVREALARMKSQ